MSKPPPSTQPGVTYTVHADHVLVVDATGEQWRIPIKNAGPSTLRRAANFGRAVAKHAAAGAHRATDAQVDARWAICQGCDWFKVAGHTGKCQHITCGCVLAPSTYTGRNKLRWAEQVCPIGHWGARP